MAFDSNDVRISRIVAYIAELTARATGIMDPLLPGQLKAADSDSAKLLFDQLRRSSIEYESEISDNYFTPAILAAFEARVALAMNTLNNPLNTKDPIVLANELFAFSQEQDLLSSENNKARFARESARGATYIQKLQAGRAFCEMLDAEAISALLERANLPAVVDHYEAQRKNGGPLERNDLEAIRRELTGYTDTSVSNKPVVVQPKNYMIVSLSQDNIHWYGNIYHLVNGQPRPLFDRDYDYAMGNNTCGISAVARGLQEISRLIPQYHFNFPAPNASAEILSAAANSLLLAPRAAQHSPAISPAAQSALKAAQQSSAASTAPQNNASVNKPAAASNSSSHKHVSTLFAKNNEAAIIQKQAEISSQFKRKTTAAEDTIAETKFAEMKVKAAPSVLDQIEQDRILALQFAAEELTPHRSKP